MELLSPHKIATESPMNVTAAAHGKVILIGEHAVVHGASAIAIPLTTMACEFTLRSIDEKKNSQQTSTLVMQGKTVSQEVASIIDEALELLGKSHFYAKVEGSSSLPVGAGLGASASLAVGLLRLLSSSFAIQLSQTNLAVLANQLEKRFHGTPSGLDTTVVAYAQPIKFKKPNLIETLDISPPRREGTALLYWPFVLLDTNVRSPTRHMIQISNPYFTGSEGRKHVEKFDHLASVVESALKEGSYATMVEVLNTAHALLHEAGIVTSQMTEMRKRCLDLDIPAVKPTGAGGGGCMLALLDPLHVKQQTQLLKNTFGANAVYEVFAK